MSKLITYSENIGKYNMDYDAFLLDEAIKLQIKEPVLRFYGWKPKCVSLGRNQNFESINYQYCKENNIDIVKRITGGRGLLHDDEVTYSFICPIDFINNGNTIINSYKEISSAIIQGFQHLNIELCLGGKKKADASHDYCMLLSTGADLCYENKKLIGSAQYRTQNYLLQHGSVLFSYNKSLLENIFNEKINSNYITCVNEINSNLDRNNIIDAVQKGFEEYFSISFL